MFLVTCYTLINHMLHGFSEEAGHWVMWPFLKITPPTERFSHDHTFILALPKSKHLYAKLFYLFVIVILLIGLYFSYTRAAWLTMFGGLLVYLLFYFKIKMKWLLSLSIIPLILILLISTRLGMF